MQRKSDIPARTGDPAPAGDFGTALKAQAAQAAADTAPTPRMIGTVSPTPSPVLTPPATTTSSMAPTAQSLFGANPWSTGAGGTGPSGSYAYNPYTFPTPPPPPTPPPLLSATRLPPTPLT